MKRSLIALMLVAVTATGCSTAERPEGVVERWLVSLNQGAAGHPDRYAPDEVSETVLPGWRDREPGDLDLIQVGSAGRGEGGSTLVAFRLDQLDGTITRGYAVVQRQRGALRIVGVQAPTDSGPIVDSTFARRSAGGARPIAWLAAFGVAFGLILLTIALMRLVPERGPELRTRPGG